MRCACHIYACVSDRLANCQVHIRRTQATPSRTQCWTGNGYGYETRLVGKCVRLYWMHRCAPYRHRSTRNRKCQCFLGCDAACQIWVEESHHVETEWRFFGEILIKLAQFGKNYDFDFFWKLFRGTKAIAIFSWENLGFHDFFLKRSTYQVAKSQLCTGFVVLLADLDEFGIGEECWLFPCTMWAVWHKWKI